MFNEGHETGRIPLDELLDARIDALVYREYLDPDYTQPNTAKLVPSDSTEPPWNRRVPGALIWARPGERLYVHVRNADPQACHSFHVHGLRYCIDSDGAWPFGVATRDGRRSDEIRPGESWTYVYDVTDEMIGAWPFHDHVRHVQASVDRGLFGAIIVRDPQAPRVDHEVPMFFHSMAQGGAHCIFQSGTLSKGQKFEFVFPDANEVCSYICQIHGASMSGRVRVTAGAPGPDRPIAIKDNAFDPPDVTITAGTKVIWTNLGNNQHIVFSGGGGRPSFCLNGRAFVGNTPIITGNSGESIRWYVFNLDVGSIWHNFHPHASRWQLPKPPGGASDVHALSPVESFVVDTEVPCALRLPCELEELQHCPPTDACLVTVCSDFLFHCHIEEHMMAGLAGLVRARQKLWITDQVRQQMQLLLPLGCCERDCGPVDLRRCPSSHPEPPPRGHGGHGGHDDHGDHGAPPAPGGVPEHILMIERDEHPLPQHEHEHTADHKRRREPKAQARTQRRNEHDEHPPAEEHAVQLIPMTVPAVPPPDPLAASVQGFWELLPCQAPVLAVHAVLLRTGKVLFFAGSGNDELYTTGLRSAVYDYENGGFTQPPTPVDVFCAGQTVLPDGRVLVAGGTELYGDPFLGLQTALLFDPVTEQWTFVHPMKSHRWYPTLLTLADGRALVTSGIGTLENEIYANPTGWSVAGPGIEWPLYPHLHLLESGRVFHSGMRLGGSALQPGFLAVASGAFTPLPASAIPASFQLGARDQGATVLLPPAQTQRVMVMGGGSPSINAVHIIDTSAPAPKYVATASMLRPRIHVNAVILPDRTVVATGGSHIAEDAATASLEAEIYDPATNTWTTGARARVPRLYHSIALLMPDGRVLTAGSNPSRRNDELRLELYHPPYLFRGPRPCIEQAPAEVRLGQSFLLHSPHAADIKWISLIRPMATTHSYDSDQRLVDIPFRRRRACHLHASLPGNPSLVPPGYYLLFLVNQNGVPSVGRWLRVLPAAPPSQTLLPGTIVVGATRGLLQVDPDTGALTLLSEGPALGGPQGLSFDGHGHLVVATESGEVLHVVPETGAQTLIHSSERQYQDVAVGPDGDPVVVDLPSATRSGVFRIDHERGTAVQLNTGNHLGDGPTGIVLGRDGHYYVCESGKRAVIRVDKDTGAETVVSRGGHLVGPSGIALSNDGHLLVVDQLADAIVHIHPDGGEQKLVSQGGLLRAPVDIASDPAGNILVVDLVQDRLILVDHHGGTQKVLAQGGALAGLRCVAVFGGG